MLEIEVYGLGKELTRISKRKWREMIDTIRNHGVQMREKVLSVGWKRWQKQNITTK